MKLPFKSMRWRLQAWHGVLLLLVLLAVGLKSYFLARENRFGVIDQELQRQCIVDAEAIVAGGLSVKQEVFGNPGRATGTSTVSTNDALEPQSQAKYTAILDRNEQAGFYYILWHRDGTVRLCSHNLPGDIPRPVVSGTLNSRMRTRGDLREQFIETANGSQLLVGRSIATDLASLHHLAIRIASFVCVIMTFGLAGGWWLSTCAIRPIEEMTTTASKIAEGNITERINLSDTDSELGQLARVLNASFDQLRAALDRQVQFTADASHELRTPVSVVLAEANSALARERTPAEYQEALESCRRAARRMRLLTESLFKLARLDSGEQPGKHEPCDLQVVVLEAINLLRPLAEERSVKLHADLCDGPCIGDAEQLGQVVTNLVSNAIQYNRPGGEVRVRLSSGGQTMVLNVIDTGQGIAAEDLPHIFDRFYRADKSRSRADGHVGLGLAITKAIVEAHGGNISVSSEAGSGTTFTVGLKRPGGHMYPAFPRFLAINT